MLLAALVALPDGLLANEQNDNGRLHVSSGSKWEEMAAYSRAVVDGCWVFVSGTVGFDPMDSSISEDFDDQMDQIFKNLEATLDQANAVFEDIVRIRSYIVDKKYVTPMSRKLKKYMDEIRPTNTTIITDLAAEGALVELEITALKRRGCE